MLFSLCCVQLIFKIMTPREKANELISKFVTIELSQLSDLVDGIRISLAKKSALILINELLEATPINPTDTDWDDCGESHKYWYEQRKIDAAIYWNEVKIEVLNF
jgi:hypothetical protein